MISSITSSQVLPLFGILSIVMFIGSLIAVPWLILRMAPDYFIRHRYKVIKRHCRHPVLTIVLFSLRNTIGLSLFVAGFAMLLLPGQGILTMLIGLSLMDFPGKYRLFDKVVQNNKVQKSLNWIREKGGKEILVFTGE